jgi:peptidoglycan/LPS O-acetylase OafA/YrhL
MRAALASNPLRGRLPGLDGLRGLAILLVMAVHFVGNATPRGSLDYLAVKLSSYGVLGVDLFFVLSGFLITGLLLDSRGDPHYFRNFYARRTLRIFPLYYAVLALLFLVLPRVAALPLPLEESRAHQAWLWTYTSNFFVAAKASWALPYVSHFWSLAIEEQFYLAWPLVVSAVRREVLERICLAGIAAALALRIALSLGGTSEISISVLTPCRLDAICVGALLAAVARREGGATLLLRRAGAAALAAGSAALLVSAFCAATRMALPVLHPVRGTLYAIFFGALLLLVARPREQGLLARAFQGRWLRTFGKYSYGLYIYQGLLAFHLVGLGAQDRLAALLGSNGAAMAAQAVLGVSASLALAALSYELFEKRFLALKKLFAQGSAAEIAAAPQALPAAEVFDRRFE